MAAMTQSIRMLPLVVLALAACHTPPGEGGSASATPTSTQAAAAPGTAAPMPTSNEKAPTLAGSDGTVTLAGGAMLSLPKGAKPREVSAGRVPAEVAKAHLFELGHNKRLLMVNEFKMDGKDCKERLDEEWKKMMEAKNDKDPTRLAIRRMTTVDETKIDGHRVLYGEFIQTQLTEAEEKPTAAMASMTMCQGNNHVVLMYASDQPALPGGIRKTLTSVVKSYKPKP
jgi:hypothetical protein